MMYFVGAISGLLLVLSFPPVDIYPFAFIALAPFLIIIHRLSGKEAFKAGFFMGLVYFFGTTYWIYHSMHYYGGMGLVLSLIIVFALACYLALYPALFSWIFSVRMKNSRLPSLILAPALWVSLEYLRSYFITGFPWSTLGYSQWKFLSLIQVADITGVYGVSFIVVGVNAAIADYFILKRRMREMPLFPTSYTFVTLIGFVLGLVFVFSYGFFRMSQPIPGAPLKASVVQGNIDQAKKWDVRFQDEVLTTYEKLTTGAFLENPQLIVWPESSLPFPLDERDPRLAQVKQLEAASGTPLIVGAIREKPEKPGAYANSAALIDAGNISYVYDKIHLVPFGEYIPMRRVLFFVNKLSDAIGQYEPGATYRRGAIKQGQFATLVCYEIVFPGLVRKFFRDGGDFIVTITNDAWFGGSSGPYQHWSMAALRAVENRKPVIRAANTGISGFFSSRGEVIKQTRLFERKTLTAQVTTDPRKTIYSRFGDLFAYVCILITLFFMIFSQGKKV
jgi:apolipoprotein N-acyltransferase